MCDEEENTLSNKLLSTVSDSEAAERGGNGEPDCLMQKGVTPCAEVSFYISETTWSSVSWQLELARRILNYSTYSLAVFDVIYVGMLILEIIVNFNQWSSMHRSGGVPFAVFFVILFTFNAFLPPLGLHLIKSILLDPATPAVFQQASKYDPKFHFRMHGLAHFNCAASLLAVFLSFFTNPLYRSIQLPFLVLYVVPISFTLSVLVCLLEGHRLLACQFAESLDNGEYCETRSSSSGRSISGVGLDDNSSRDGLLNRSSLTSSQLSRGYDIYKLRDTYYQLHLRFDLVRQNWGLYILFVIMALLLITVGLVWYSYISDFNRVKFSLVLPYIVIAMFGVCQLLISLTLVNEFGAKVSKALAKYVFKHHGHIPGDAKSTTSADINNLLILSQIVLIEIPFVEGFTLRVKLTAVLVGPLIGSILPKILAR